MLRFLCFGLILLTSSAFAHDFVPLKILFAAAQFFPTVDFCNRTCTTSYKIKEDNVRYVAFSCTLKKGECAETLGNCIKTYIDQTDWLKGATTKITSAGGKATLEITGTCDPTYDPKAKFDSELGLLGEIFKAFPNADLAGLKCKLSSKVDSSGRVHCIGVCKKKPGDNRPHCKFLDASFNYFNQVKLVNNFSKQSKDCGKTVLIEFVGSAVPGQKCDISDDEFFVSKCGCEYEMD